MKGTMLWFNPAKRHGFTRTDEGERLRVNQEGFAAREPLGGRCRGTRVGLERAADELEQVQRVNVAVVPLFAARLTRLRGCR